MNHPSESVWSIASSNFHRGDDGGDPDPTDDNVSEPEPESEPEPNGT